ncbi:hypothetical protein MBLNU13_g07736t1 [Cladosporium sp. NU13]
MGSQHAFDLITASDFEEILLQYLDCVPAKLAKLEEQRLSKIPTVLAKRRAEGQAYLTKTEVATLVDWKLSHGKFRPSLKGLVQQNSEEFVNETTTEGFSEGSWAHSLDVLTRLKGIGPATASLLLSTSDPETLPFFSDELFRWAFWENKSGAGWDRKIKYSVKEYRELKEKVNGLRDRIGKGAIEVEKVAYVLGKREADLGASQKSDQVSRETDVSDSAPLKTVPRAAKASDKNSKRKAAQVTAPDESSKPEPKSKKQKSAVPSISQRVTRSSSKTDS